MSGSNHRLRKLLLTTVMISACSSGCGEQTPEENHSDQGATGVTDETAFSAEHIDEALNDYDRRSGEWSELKREFLRNPDAFRANETLWSQWLSLCADLGTDTDVNAIWKPVAELDSDGRDSPAPQIAPEIHWARLERAKQLLAADPASFRALDLLSQLTLTEDLPEDLRAESDALFDRKTGRAGQLWLLRQCDAHVGTFALAWPGWEAITVMELWCLWHARTVIGEHASAAARLEEAFVLANRSEKASTAANAGTLLAGALFSLQRDEETRRAIDIAATGLESGAHRNPYLYCYIGALSYLLGDHEKAEHFQQRARRKQRWYEHTDAMYLALCRRIAEARGKVDAQAAQRSLAVLSLCAAAENQLDESTSAKRRLLQWIEGDSRDFSSEKAILVRADAMAGRLEMAERRAFNLPKGYSRSVAYTAIASEYIRRGDPDKANTFISQSSMTYGTMETGFYLARARIRRHPSLSALYRWACSAESEAYRLALLCGLVAGLNDDLPARPLRHISPM